MFLREFSPLEIEYVELEKEKMNTKHFYKKDYLIDLFKNVVEFDKNKGVLKLPFYDERYLSGVIFNESKKKRMVPGGFKLIDYSLSYSPLGRCVVSVYGSVFMRKAVDFRHMDEKKISETQYFFVNKESTNRWHLVDLKNEGHETTILYKEIEEKEEELESHYKEVNQAHYLSLRRMMNTKNSYVVKEEVKAIFESFLKYIEETKEGLEMYRFFDWITPLEKKYISKYMEHLVESVTGLYSRFPEIQNEKEIDMLWEEKVLFNEMTAVAQRVRLFFMPRNEMNPLASGVYGYCPTKYFADELKEKRMLIPNIAQIESRVAFSSENFFHNEKAEKAVEDKLIKHFFNLEETKEENVD